MDGVLGLRKKFEIARKTPPSEALEFKPQNRQVSCPITGRMIPTSGQVGLDGGLNGWSNRFEMRDLETNRDRKWICDIYLRDRGLLLWI